MDKKGKGMALFGAMPVIPQGMRNEVVRIPWAYQRRQLEIIQSSYIDTLQEIGEASIQEIIFISQVIQRVEVFSRSTTGWMYHQFGAGQSFFLASLDVEIEVRQLYRRLSIPAVVEEVKEEDISGPELGNNE